MRRFFHSWVIKGGDALAAQSMLLLAPLLMSFGIVVYYGLWVEPPIMWPVAVLLGWVALTIVMRRRAMAVVMVAFGFVLFGFTLSAWHGYLQQRQDIAPAVRADIVDIKFLRGQVIAMKSSNSDHAAAIFKVREVDGVASKEFLVRVTDPRQFLGDDSFQDNNLPLFCDMTIKAKIFLLPLKKSLNNYDLGRDWYFHGYRAGGQLMAPPIVDDGCNVATSRSLGQKIKNNIIKNYPPDVGGMVLAMITGERSGIGADLMEQYRQSGLIHLISISGVHMGLIAGIAFLLVRLLLVAARPSGDGYLFKKIAAVAAMGITIFYFLLADYSSASLRALLTTMVAFVGVILGRRAISLENLALSMLLVLCYRSVDLFNPGFQLSFSAMLLLVGLYEKFWQPLVQEIEQGVFFRQPAMDAGVAIFMGQPLPTHKPPRTLFKKIEIFLFALVVSGAMITLAGLPIVLFHFHEASLFGIVANMAAIPLMDSLAMPLLFIKVLLLPLTNIVGDVYPLDWLITKIFRMLNWLATNAHGDAKHLIHGGGFGLGALFFYGVGFYLFVVGGRGLKRLSYFLLILFVVLAVSNPKPWLVVAGLEPGGRIKWVARFDDGKGGDKWVSPNGDSFVRRLWAEEYGISQFEKQPPPPAVCSRAMCQMAWRYGGNKKFTVAIIGDAPLVEGEFAKTLCRTSDMVIGHETNANMQVMKKNCPEKIESPATATMIIAPRPLMMPMPPGVRRITLRPRPWILAALAPGAVDNDTTRDGDTSDNNARDGDARNDDTRDNDKDNE